MKTVYIDFDNSGYVAGWGTSRSSEESAKMDVDEETLNQLRVQSRSMKLEGNSLVNDDTRQQEIAEELEFLRTKPTTKEEVDKLKSLSSALVGGEEEDKDEILVAASLNHALRLFAKNLPEKEALEVAAIYPRWTPNTEYKVDDIVRYGKNQDSEPQIFRVEQDHQSQQNWTPNVTASLFTKLGFTEEGTPTWVQPLGAHDAYQKDDVVSHNEVIYKSTVNGNTWEPGVYGWVVASK